MRRTGPASGRYYAAIKAYQEMIAVLEDLSHPGEFEEAYARAEGVRFLFVRARNELEEHVREHGCELADGAIAAG